MATVPVPVHFDGHNINIITEDSPSMCKDRTKNLSLYRKKNVRSPSRKKSKKGTRNADTAKPTEIPRDTPSDQKAPHSPHSLSPCSNKDSSNERADSISPGDKNKNTNTNAPQELEQDPTTPGDHAPAHDAHPDAAAKGVEHCSDDGTLSAASPPHDVSSPPKSKGTNINAKPFVMSPNAKPFGENPRTNAKSTMNGRHREDYQPPPRLRENVRGGFQPHCPPARNGGGGGGPNHKWGQPHEQPHHVTDEELIAAGLNPAEFGSHDDAGFEDEDEQKLHNKGKERRSLFKTELCREWSTSGWCYYNKRCSFAHGLHELRPVFRSRKWRTKRCRNWHTTGYCPYEHRCQFLHDQSPPRRMTDYTQTNARALAAAQQRMKPLYFHYQVDCARDADGTAPAPAAAAAANNADQAQRDHTPGSSNSRSASHHSAGVPQQDLTNHSLYKAAVERADAAAKKEAAATDVASTNSKGKKRKTKDAVITQFNPSATVYRQQPNGLQSNGLPPNGLQPNGLPTGFESAGPQQVAAPGFALYPTVTSSVGPLPPLSATNQALLNAHNVPLPLSAAMQPMATPAAAAAMTAANLGHAAAPNNPVTTVDRTVYLNFSPENYEEEPAAPNGPLGGQHDGQLNGQPIGGHVSGHVNHSVNGLHPLNMAVMQGGLHTMGGYGGLKEVEVPASLTPPPDGVDGQNVEQLAGAVYNGSVFEHTMGMNEMSRQHLLAHQQMIGNEMYNMSANMSPSPSCLLDDDALMQLLPHDPLVPVVSTPQQHQHHVQKQHDSFPDDDQKHSDNVTRGNVQLSASPQSAAHSKTAKSGISHSNPQRDDDEKDGDGVAGQLSMKDIAPPCPPALQLQTSADSCNPVVLGAVDAGMFGLDGVNASPATAAAIHVDAFQAQQLMVRQHAHQYAQQAAVAAAGGMVGVTQYMNPYVSGLNPYAVTPDMTAVGAAAAAASPFVYNMQPLMTHGLRVQPPQTVMAAAAATPTADPKTSGKTQTVGARVGYTWV